MSKKRWVSMRNTKTWAWMNFVKKTVEFTTKDQRLHLPEKSRRSQNLKFSQFGWDWDWWKRETLHCLDSLKKDYIWPQEILNQILRKPLQSWKRLQGALLKMNISRYLPRWIAISLPRKPMLWYQVIRQDFLNTVAARGNMIRWNMMPLWCSVDWRIVLHQGKISEMAYREGKTLLQRFCLPECPSGKGVHIITVMITCKTWLGWMVAYMNSMVWRWSASTNIQPNTAESEKCLSGDITFGTNNEFVLITCVDNMTSNPEEMVQREHNYANRWWGWLGSIDDARTPLIISGPTPKGENQEFEQMKRNIVKLYSAQRNL